MEVDLGGLDEVEIDVTVVEARRPGEITDEVEIEIDMDEIDIDMDVGADVAEVQAAVFEIDEVEIDEVEIDEVEPDEVELDEVELEEVEAEEVEAEEVEADSSDDGELLSGASLFVAGDEVATVGIPADEEAVLDLAPIGVPDDDDEGPSLDLGSVGVPLDDDEEPL